MIATRHEEYSKRAISLSVYIVAYMGHQNKYAVHKTYIYVVQQISESVCHERIGKEARAAPCRCLSMKNIVVGAHPLPSLADKKNARFWCVPSPQ